MFARFGDSDDPATWEKLEDHLRNVGDQAAQLGESIGSADWARAAGRLHDVCKASDAFQKYLQAAAAGETVVRGSVNHSTA